MWLGMWGLSHYELCAIVRKYPVNLYRGLEFSAQPFPSFSRPRNNRWKENKKKRDAVMMSRLQLCHAEICFAYGSSSAECGV